MSARFESKVASYGWLRTVVVCIVVIVAVFWVLTFAFDRYLVSASGSHPYSGLVAVDDNQCLLSEGGEKARWNVILDDGQHTAGVLTGEVSAVSLDDWAGRDSQSLRCLDSEELAERQE